jgi:hypothetical protein
MSFRSDARRRPIVRPHAALIAIALGACSHSVPLPHEKPQAGRQPADAAVVSDAAVDAAKPDMRDAMSPSQLPAHDSGSLSCASAFEAFSERVEDAMLEDVCCDFPPDYEQTDQGLPPPISLACACSIAECHSLADMLEGVAPNGAEPPYLTRCGCGHVSIGLRPGIVRTYDLRTHELVGVWISSDLTFGPCQSFHYRAGVLDIDCAEEQPCSASEVLGSCRPSDHD